MTARFADDEVIFAGIDNPESATNEFGIYVPINDKEAVWLPASTSNPKVVDKLSHMELGQVFRITGQQSKGSIGTEIHSLEVVSNKPRAKVPGTIPPFLAL